MVEVMKIMVTSFKRSHAHTATLSAPNSAAGHCQLMPPPETPGHSQELWSVSYVLTAPFSQVLVCPRFCLCPPRVCLKVLHSICQQIWKTQQLPQDWKRSVFIPIPKKGNAKECTNYHTIALISHATKVMLKILQARLWQYVNHELPDVQAGFRKGRGTRDQITTSVGSSKKQDSSRKTSAFALLTMPKPLIVWITINCGKF